MAAGDRGAVRGAHADVLEAVNARGDRLRTRLGDVFAAHGLPMCDDRAGLADEHPRHTGPGPLHGRPRGGRRSMAGTALLRRARCRLLPRPARLHRAVDRDHRRRHRRIRRGRRRVGNTREHSRMADFDLIVRGGSLHDGNGSEPRTADVAVPRRADRRGGPGRWHGCPRDRRRRACSSRPASSTSTAHYDGQATWDDRLQPVVVARRHHRRDEQLRRRLRAGARPATTTASSS